MNTFTLQLMDARHSERVENVVSFVGEDGTGQFGIQAWHEPVMTMLDFGLARFRREEGDWEYLGLPGGLLYMTGNQLRICSTHYLRGNRRERLTQVLEAELRREQALRQEFRGSLRRLEEELLRRLWRMSHGGI
jgi:F-type H+-transporting ATPase subunit epsilon